MLADESCLHKLPMEGSLVFIIGQSKEWKIYSEFAQKCIQNNVLYVCTSGPNCELIHDIFDETIVARKIAKGESVDRQDDFENSPMTTWHHNFSEGFWFAITSAHHDSGTVEKIVCVDFTDKGVKGHFIDLIGMINGSWLPSDEKQQAPIYDAK
jgi:hypothetical protein